MKIFGSIVAYIIFGLIILILTVLFPVFLIFKIFRFEAYFIKCVFILIRFAVKIGFRIIGIKLIITRDDAFYSYERSVVIMANHIASMDLLFLMLVFKKPFIIVVKSSLLSIPLVNFMLISMGVIFVSRGNIKSSALAQKRAMDAIEKGWSIGIFPEGTRNRGGKTRNFKRGSVNLALRTNSPIIPVTLLNTEKFFIKNFILNSGLSIYVHVHFPINISSLTNYEIDNLHVIVRDRIVKKLEDMKIQYNIDRNLNESK
ncbi:lysophospholipid acyltransferase family protein [Borrelia sp. HM]|uniref:lysophospholipid acyltransferase family protein n=1 Tax=Borrelia sp. HM TaxID=1882662 RepID=UPI001C7431D2|nr:lysophospholipid acyltransferase family protein [Borrelia sp. HM]BCR21485.1 1-acyl-sn-glycerol-3-phosphate acyltransferase [Borrelia sp. HM]